MNNCENHNTVFVRLITSNGAIQLRKQCFNCGEVEGVIYKHSNVVDVSTLPELDAIKRSEYEDKAHESYIVELRKEAQKRSNDYNMYIQSPEWKAKSNYILNKYMYTCVLCGDRAVDVHHLTYKRCDWVNGICVEDERDLIAVCRDCHGFVHGKADETAIALQP